MTYSEPLINQVRIFLLSVGTGVPLCFLYIALQSACAFFGKRRWAMYTADIVFSVLSALVSFFFMVFYNSGRVRLHLVIGEAVGFFMFYFAAGKYLLAVFERIAVFASRVAGFFLYPLLRVIRAFGNIYYLLKDACRGFSVSLKSLRDKKTEKEAQKKEKVKKERKKFNFIGKIHLKNPDKSV